MLIFIDESGNHELINNPNDTYPIFVLGAFCISEENYKVFEKKFNNLKKYFFGSDDFILHTVEITRPNKSTDSRNLFFKDKDFRQKFYSEMENLILETPFFIISSVIQKNLLVEAYGIHASDPYHMAMENIINRLLWHSYGPHKFYPEQRNPVLDKNLQKEIEYRRVYGTIFHSAEKIDYAIREFKLCEKEENIAGQQLIDLLVTPIGRHILGKTPRPGNEIRFSVIEQKIVKSRDLVVFPKKNFRTNFQKEVQIEDIPF